MSNRATTGPHLELPEPEIGAASHRPVSALIIGAGFAGIAAAIELTKHGYRNVTILEQAAELGGTWWANQYPGAACDVPSPLYSYSFAPNPAWTQRFPGQPEILDYMRRTAREFGVEQLIRYNTRVTTAEFDADRLGWRVQTDSGETFEADVLVPAVGVLSIPSFPRIAGLDSFTGRAFHSAQWDADVDLSGKRVAVIGTGASTIQFVPKLQKAAAHVTVYQRSAQWIVPRPQKFYGALQRRLFRAVPLTHHLERGAISLLTESLQWSMTKRTKPMVKVWAAAAQLYLRSKIREPKLRAALTPDYPAGCKRILFDAGYFDALLEPNVDLVTDAITEITPSGVRTADGTDRSADVIVYGTGFAATDVWSSIKTVGRDALQLSEVWAEGAHAYYGLAVPGFPNLLFMYGPNTSLGSGSIIGMLEPQARYVRKAVQYLDSIGGGTFEVRADVEAASDAEIQARVNDSVWTACTSWYRNANGRVVANWPGTVGEYVNRTATFDPADYLIDRPQGVHK